MAAFKVDASSTTQTHYKQAIESDHLGQWDLRNRVTGERVEPVVTIESITLFVPAKPRMKRGTDGVMRPEKINKYRITFLGKRKALIANATIQSQIAALYGPRLEDWIGKKIKLYVDPKVKMGNKVTGGIRVWDDAPQQSESPTDDPLDNVADERVKALLDDAFDREPGDENGK